MTSSIEVGKALGKTQHHFIIKTFQLGTKSIYEKLTMNTILNSD
jgi:hypothetical protein